MILDSSVIMAMLLREPGAEAFEELIAHSIEFRGKRSMSAASVLECSIVARKRLGESGGRELDTLIGLMKIEIRTFDLDQLKWARFALETYGRGQHPARLNFGDCFSYALAKSSGEPILFKGTDFSLTDLASA
jgi:ribonuclease VapC